MMHAHPMCECLGILGKVSLARTGCRKLAFTHGWQMASSKWHSWPVSNSYSKWITANGSQSVPRNKTNGIQRKENGNQAAVGRTGLPCSLSCTSLVHLPNSEWSQAEKMLILPAGRHRVFSNFWDSRLNVLSCPVLLCLSSNRNDTCLNEQLKHWELMVKLSTLPEGSDLFAFSFKGSWSLQWAWGRHINNYLRQIQQQILSMLN